MIKGTLALLLALSINADAIASTIALKRKAEDGETDTRISKTGKTKRVKQEESESLLSSSLIQRDAFNHKSKNTYIDKLDLSNDQDLIDIRFIHFFPHVTDLNISNCINLKDNYYPISQLINLKKLKMRNIGFKTLKPIKPLVNLTSLSIAFPDIDKAMKYIVKLPKLKELDIRGYNYEGLKKISQLTGIEKLVLSGFSADSNFEEEVFPSLDFISPLINLKELSLSGNTQITSIKPIIKLHLTSLNLSGCDQIEDFYYIKKIKSLIELDLRQTIYPDEETFKRDLSAIKKLKNLKNLKLDKEVAKYIES